ncbi:hypothetical protein SAMN05444274_105100 [Mariniphaga anaerophila]|uniref:Uncharacterized protein n=1 Tax=Mariniphaga anaerophila TaxID=1484053 RepID=A0A1M5BDR1_9BACT|nr:UPF0280 family protein [Mariniphaga anaerophila]SHF40578.1 hypothetical protein SAMN05444274_105100 [Mariniphaga anaerophila]
MKYEQRFYRNKFNSQRFRGFQVSHRETDLWIGVDPDSFENEMEEVVRRKIVELRQKLDVYIESEPQFAKSLIPYNSVNAAPAEAKEMAQAAARAGIGPMGSVAGLFSREAGRAILENFSVKELVIENGGDIFALLKKELVLSVFAGSSPLSEKIGIVIPAGIGEVGICTSAGTVGPSFSFGKADAVAVICRDVLLADALATALGNEVKSPEDVEKVIGRAEEFPEILSLLIICKDKVGITGGFEIKLLK